MKVNTTSRLFHKFCHYPICITLSVKAVIINEHLMEALRRLRRTASETNVDRRLVTNVLLSFLSTPRADPKRFEMLTLLSSILSWTDPEREKAGLQRSSSSLGPGVGGVGLTPSPSFWSRSNSHSPGKQTMDLEKTDETEVRRFLRSTLSNI